ncbi:metallophosphoesterase family protein [Maricaulis sp. CAU 1757]
MAFRFVHTADWQLGRSFKNFEPELAAQLAAARLDVIETIGAVAEKEDAKHIFVAGDVWDMAAPSDKLLRQPLDRMAAFNSVIWWLLPGNHDPAQKHGLWDRLKSIGLPENVKTLTTQKAVYPEPGVAVLPAPYHSKNPGRDLTSDFDAMEVEEGCVRIGVAHGGVEGFFDQSHQSAVIDRNRADSAGLDYLALGDWHGRAQVNERTWYAGTPEPDRFPNNDPGWVLVAEVERGETPSVKPVRTGKFTWTRDRVDCIEGIDLKERISAVLDAHGSRHLRLSRLELCGELRLQDRMELLAFVEKETASLAHLRARYEGLSTVVDHESLSDILPDGALRDAGNEIAARINATDATGDEKAVAKRALDLLATFSQKEEIR